MAYTAVARANITRDIYNNFYNMITANITDTQSPARTATSWCFSTWPQDKGNNKSDYPIIIINPSMVSTSNRTMTRTQINGSLSIEIYMAGDKSAKYADDLLDQIINILRQNKYTNLRNTGLLHKAEISDTSADVIMHDRLKVHIRSATISFEYVFNDT